MSLWLFEVDESALHLHAPVPAKELLIRQDLLPLNPEPPPSSAGSHSVDPGFRV